MTATRDRMDRVVRKDRAPIEPTIFREAMVSVYGERPDFREAERELGVPKSTLHRLWNGGRTVSAKNLERLSEKFGVHPGWLSYGLHGQPLARLKGALLSWGVHFPGTPRNEVQGTTLDVSGLHQLARIREAATTLGPAKSDPDVHALGLADTLGDRWIPPVPVAGSIDGAIKLVAEEWGRELGRLPRRDRQRILAAWLQAWVVTLESAREVPRAAK